MFKLGFEKAEEPEIKLPTSLESQKKQESSRKTSTSALLTMPKQSLWLCVLQQTVKNSSKNGNTRLPTCFLRNLCAGQEATLRIRYEQWTGSKLGKESVKAIYCHLAYLTSMQSTQWKLPGWMKHELESGLLGEISLTSDMQITPSLWQKAKRN